MILGGVCVPCVLLELVALLPRCWAAAGAQLVRKEVTKSFFPGLEESKEKKSARRVFNNETHGLDGVLAYYTGHPETGQRRPVSDKHVLNRLGLEDALPNNLVASLLQVSEPTLHSSLHHGRKLHRISRDNGQDWHDSGLRFVAHGIVGPEICKIMRQMFERSPKDTLDPGERGDYQSNDHTALEFAAGDLQYYTHDPDFPVLLALRQLITKKVQSFFGGNDRIQPDLTHLTRRKQGTMMATHVDNCMIQENGTCTRISTRDVCCSWRSHTAQLYLSDEDAKGGDFFFAAGKDSDKGEWRFPRIVVKPKCGTLVAFSAGPENPHGVMPVLSGVRYSLAVWHTEQTSEYEHIP